MKSISVELNPDRPDIDDIDKYYREISRLLEIKFSKMQNLNFGVDFFGMTISEIDNLYQELYKELNFETSFALLSLIEAKFREDFVIRKELLRKDPLGKEFRKLKPRPKIYTYELKREIMNLWKKYNPDASDLIHRIYDALNFRHWIAHGRYWTFHDNVNKFYYQDMRSMYNVFISILDPKLKKINN